MDKQSFLNDCQPVAFLITFSGQMFFIALLIRILMYYYKLRLIECLVEGFTIFETERNTKKRKGGKKKGLLLLGRAKKKEKTSKSNALLKQVSGMLNSETMLVNESGMSLVSLAPSKMSYTSFDSKHYYLIRRLKRSRMLSTNKAAGIFLLIGVCISLFLSFINMIFTCPGYVDGVECPEELHVYHSLALVMIYFSCTVLLLLFSYWRTKNYPDLFGFLRETAIISIVSFLLFVLAFLFEKFDPGHFHEREPISFEWSIMFDLNTYFVLLYIFPYRLYRSTKSGNVGSSLDFGMILSNPIAFKMFKQHLKKEYSAPNLCFWKAMKEWREAYDHESRDVRENIVMNIYRKWLREDSPTEVAVNSQVRTKLEETIFSDVENGVQSSNRFPKKLFDDIISEVYRLMEEDSFVRFKATKLYKVYIGIVPNTPERSLSNYMTKSYEDIL